MRYALAVILALAIGGCAGGGLTQAQVDEMVLKAGNVAYAKAKLEAEARLVQVFVGLGKTPEESVKLASEEADRIGDVARLAAEDLTRKALEKVKSTDGGENTLGKIGTILGTIGLNLLMGYAQSKTKGG